MKEKAMLKAGRVWALGTMSGTSLDGVDAALVETDGEQIFGFGETGYLGYSNTDREVLRAALGKWDDIDDAREIVEAVHLGLLSDFDQAELIGFHGQTLAHEPRRQRTHQVGNGATLAQALDLPVVWDFRTADMEMGGEGAPLAPFYHFACAKWIDEHTPLAFLNIGGVSNLTYVDPTFDAPEDEGALLAFDTGPGNAQINDLMRARLGLEMDKDGEMAAKGQVNDRILKDILNAAYFYRVPPKSLDRDTFSFVIEKVADLNDQDAAATLTMLSAEAVYKGMIHCPRRPKLLLVTGGGRKNPVLMEMLRARLACEVLPVEEVGLNGDMLEAQAFAYLAVRVARGLPTSCPSTTGVPTAVSGGKLSYPSKEK